MRCHRNFCTQTLVMLAITQKLRHIIGIIHRRNTPNPDDPSSFLPERSRQYYDRKLRLYSALVSRVYRTPIDSTTRTRWTEVAMLGRAGDTFLDTGSNIEMDERHNLFIAILKSSSFDELYPEISRDALGQTVHEKYVAAIQRIVEMSRRAKCAPSPRRYLATRAFEGAIYADMAEILASDATAESPSFKRFIHQLRAAGAWATIGNSVLDYRGDVARGEISLDYSLKDHLYMAKVQLLSIPHYAQKALRSTIRRG